MAITTLDTHTALVVIDLQQGIVAFPTAHPVAPIVANAAKLTAAFRKRNLPVVLVNVAGGASGRADVRQPAFNPPPNFIELCPELDRQPSDILITKFTLAISLRINSLFNMRFHLMKVLEHQHECSAFISRDHIYKIVIH